ncbi:MAG: LacI family transcriptional regulator [Anaerolineaceae bacterium]|nr:MAG: LacI family transcriptional regulator [Anaerolineaceae bacterium]
MKAGIKQISDITGFSAATISNALNKKRGVSKQTAEEIFRVAREIGYLDSNSISKIKLVIYKKNGLIIEDTPFFTLLIDGFALECKEAGYEMSIGNLDARQEGYLDQAKQMINEADTAIVLLGTELAPEDLSIYKQAQCPILLLDYWSFDMDFNGVMINNADSARMAVNYLSRCGHKKIGYLKGSFRILGFQQRQSGYFSALRDINAEYYPEYTVEVGTTMNDAYKDMLKFLDKKPELPTAFFADNDMIALGVMKALKEKGYRIPEDISIIGFDDLPYCEISSPRLTSLRVPKQEMGRLAVRRIIDIIKENDEVRTKIQVCTEFVGRDSVKIIK